ncbi:dimethylaniline monooxygenase (N-oxide forming) [Bimuria novae-zelandiae CBS 107.79]|uniref:Dimethylaniline monooxygenase (N-oxide forming) n=1 Tax=Bimuria novae-zelandiae CBS 107.79 TaxID=1447943 RepID=A0A6A5UMZ1_9PLEO|nr:dimethylaniline monooxygenase (N-oxide forming) [Bimuria novae-zelandiae CBS 107.79]
MEEFDVVVVGAGWYGLGAAKTYLQLHPDDSILVLESASSAGGVWSRDRLYPGLQSNNLLGCYEYSDFPMDTATFGVKPGQHIPGSVLSKYLTAYAEHFGVHRHIRFNTRVESAEERSEGDGWTIVARHTETDAESTLHTKKLIVATGLTSQPNMPTFVGQEEFGGPIFHTKAFADYADTLKTARNVAVLGGSKSAWDAAYAYATAGIPVDMIIRESGRGPVWMSPPFVTPLKKQLEKLVHTRFLTWLSPCIWGQEDGFGGVRGFLHGTWFGRKIVDTFWKILGSDVIDLCGFEKHTEVKKLKPWQPAFWIGSGLGILNYPTDFFDLVKSGAIRVHTGDITRLSGKTIHLSNGTDIKADLLLCATGWKPAPPIKFLPADSELQLSLPHYSEQPDSLVTKADATILTQLPRLKDQPDTMQFQRDAAIGTKAPNQPYRLYRFIVPPSSLQKRNIAFAGMITCLATSVCAQAQGLWISAYFDGRLDRLASPDDARWEAVLHSQFTKWRYPLGYGALLPDFAFDAMPYVDMLLKDVGVESRRKGSFVKELFEPYSQKDYAGLIPEWKQRHGDKLGATQ